jgi:tetratricopeptide (TPR) repeat protein
MADVGTTWSLPDPPSELRSDPVRGWADPVTIPTYEPAEPDRYPAFLGKRVYQGSNGQVYPLPFYEAVADQPSPHPWTGLHLENEHLRVLVLPELGGRVHAVVDKATGRDLFYRNSVIKPALVGLAGPWVSGGIEFNWPQHHRPGTFLPMDWRIDREADGAVTVWCSDRDPFERMRSVHGLRLRPGSSLLELRVRLTNRTELTQTFLWWANVAVAVHDDYQSFFPTDVHVVADHAKRAVTGFPRADGVYYGIDYPARVDAEHPDADRLDWYRNIPVPTSYMCIGSADDFFGGYDHAARLGFVHVADHRIAPGKKQWTWGDSPFGAAWERNLTDTDGPYIELMAGVYTDNQPDFSFLAPGESRAFSQFWYPIHGTGPVQQATTEAAVSIEVAAPDPATSRTEVDLAAEVTRPHADAQVVLSAPDGAVLWQRRLALAPGAALVERIELPGAWRPEDLTLRMLEDGEELVSWCPRPADPHPEGAHRLQPATPPPAPADMGSQDELYLAGVHLAQYRHPTRDPDPYWEEALRRDPGDSRVNVALAERRLRDGRLSEAERLLRAAIARQTRRNPNPADGEAHYLLGVVLARGARPDEAVEFFAKSTWNAAWRLPAHLALARLALAAGRARDALAHAREAREHAASSGAAAALEAIALRRLGRPAEAEAVVAERVAADPLDPWLRDLAGEPLETDALSLIDVADEYRMTGETENALGVLTAAADAARQRPVIGAGNPLPLIHYRRAELLRDLGDPAAAAELALARSTDATRCLARGLDDALLLERALEHDPDDARAAALLGHWLLFHRRPQDAEAALRRSVAADGNDPAVWRGLALIAYNERHDPAAAASCYERAIALAPGDAKLLYEADQLASRRGVPVADRLTVLEARRADVLRRDDLTLAYSRLLTQAGREDEAIALLTRHRFHPWEGGEGVALAAWANAQQAAAWRALSEGRPEQAVSAARTALDPPETLGEAPHPLANRAPLFLDLGDALDAAGDGPAARAAWTTAADSAGDFSLMAPVPYSEATYASIEAAQRLGRTEDAARLREGLRDYVACLRRTPAEIDYFATSLPTMLIFDEDVQQRQDLLADVLTAQLALADGDRAAAEAALDRVLSTDPAHPEAGRLLRRIHAAAG